MPISFSNIPEYFVTCKQLVLYKCVGFLHIYCSDTNEWIKINFRFLPEMPILSIGGCACFFGKYIVIYSVHHMFYISVVTRNRRQYYLCVAATRKSAVFFYSLIHLDNEDRIRNQTSDERYLMITETDQDTEMFQKYSSIIFVTGKIVDKSMKRTVTYITTSETRKAEYHMYILKIKDTEKFGSLIRCSEVTFTRCFSLINPAELRVEE